MITLDTILGLISIFRYCLRPQQQQQEGLHIMGAAGQALLLVFCLLVPFVCCKFGTLDVPFADLFVVRGSNDFFFFFSFL